MKRLLKGCLFGILLLILSGAVVHADIMEGYDVFEKIRPMRLDNTGRIIGATYVLDPCEAVTGWTGLSNDTTGIAVDVDHVMGAQSLEFDKVDGTDNLTIGGIQKTITAVNLTFLIENGGAFGYSLNVSSVANIEYCFIRLGTDATNYNEWRIPVAGLATDWNSLRFNTDSPSSAGAGGTGWNSSVVTYLALGCNHLLETDLLADVRVDHIVVHAGLQVAADVNASVSSSSGASNVNLAKVGGAATDKGIGAAGPGTQRISVSTDDVVSISDDDNPNTPANPLYTQPTDGTNLAYIAPSTADDLSKSENGIKVEAVAKYDDGTALDTGKVGATGEILVGDVYTRAGENPSLGAREVKITYLGTSEPLKVGPTAVDDTALSVTTGTVILGPVKTLSNGQLCVYVKNTGGGSGDDLSDVEIYDSPDGTSGWDDANTWTVCDGLAAGTKLCKKCIDDPWPWIQIKGRCAAGEDTEAEAWLRQVKR